MKKAHPTRTPHDWVESMRRELESEAPLVAEGGWDVELACLVVARKLEAIGKPQEAAALRLDLGQKLIRAALHEADFPGPIALADSMRSALSLRSGVRSGVRKKPAKKVRR